MKEIAKSVIYRDRLKEARNSPIQTYIDMSVGRRVGVSRFMAYELVTCLFGPIPGGAGFFLRKIFYPHLFRKVGRGLIIGRNVVVRHPDKIVLGDNVTIDDNCLLDARGAGPKGIMFKDEVIINRNCMIQAKNGPIRLGSRTSIGSNSVIVSLGGVEIKDEVLIAGGCYISAGSYHFDDPSRPVMDQGMFTKGPIRIGSGAWLGTRVMVLDGVTIGDGAVIGAGSLIIKNIPMDAIAYGIPGKVIRRRNQ